MNQHAVLIDIHYEPGTLSPDSLFGLEDLLIEAVEGAGVGEYDGNEIGMDEPVATFYMYGPDADALFRVVMPVLEGADLPGVVSILRRYGDHGAREMRTYL